jgi:hypothetical protein
MNNLEHMLQDYAEARRNAVAIHAAHTDFAAPPVPAGLLDRPKLASVTPLRPAPACDTLGHEYNFGICLDCDQTDPAFEPDDDMIERDDLNRQFAA